jgi:hypothetical protein
LAVFGGSFLGSFSRNKPETLVYEEPALGWVGFESAFWLGNLNVLTELTRHSSNSEMLTSDDETCTDTGCPLPARRTFRRLCPAGAAELRTFEALMQGFPPLKEAQVSTVPTSVQDFGNGFIEARTVEGFVPFEQHIEFQAHRRPSVGQIRSWSTLRLTT